MRNSRKASAVKMTVKLEPWEVQNILLDHIEKKFKGHARKGEILEVMRVGHDAPPAFSATVEAKRPTPDPRD